MPLRAVCAVVWLALAWAPAAYAAGVRDNLYGVKAMSPTDVWIVGNYGAIFHTTDGGKTWQSRDSGTKSPLFSVEFGDADHGWIVGKSAVILDTTDGGRTWTSAKSPISPQKHLFKVKAASPTTAWAVGDWGAIAVTTDAGKTWQDRSLPTLTIRAAGSNRPDRNENVVLEDIILYDVSWPDAQHGFIAGEFATLIATADGGATWEKRTLPTEKTIFGIDFTTASEGWAVGIDGLVLHTTDGGNTWQVQHGNPEPATIEELAFTDALKNPGLYAVSVLGQTGVVVGDTGTILTSSDAGLTWTRHVLPEHERFSWLRDVSLVAGARGTVVGAKGITGAVEGTDITLSDGGKAVVATD
jgi:photosystem II stability/assembly factor-like uncharacterized protein